MLSLRLYNIPATMTQNQLEKELLTLDIPISKIYLNMKTETENAGFAIVDFASYSHFLQFGNYFPKMRHDLYIYKSIEGV
jgi:hypothetical protein